MERTPLFYFFDRSGFDSDDSSELKYLHIFPGLFLDRVSTRPGPHKLKTVSTSDRLQAVIVFAEV